MRQLSLVAAVMLGLAAWSNSASAQTTFATPVIQNAVAVQPGTVVTPVGYGYGYGYGYRPYGAYYRPYGAYYRPYGAYYGGYRPYGAYYRPYVAPYRPYYGPYYYGPRAYVGVGVY
jgi:hypothetical protein